MQTFQPHDNYTASRKAIGYVDLKSATEADYQRIGFMSGLEVHQQLRTREKLFCHCPSAHFHKHHEYDAEIIRHMRPTLSELGEYDGTALMEFRTRKEITYRIKNDTTCTYEIDDTPPFPINREALEAGLFISLLSKLKVVGEVHIIRKQYLDGSIPAGFQRTAILGVDGEIQLRHKKVGLIQLSIEEDSCREISDIGHQRIYNTDRLGMPLIETVTEPELFTPDEVMEACNYIRFLNRSTGKVFTGMGAGRQDVNVSCKGGTRVEIKGVAHTKWIPALTHNEAFRQWALLHIRSILQKRCTKAEWKIDSVLLNYYQFQFPSATLSQAHEQEHSIVAVRLPHFKGILSHFTQPGKSFADEIADRLKVIACLIPPFYTHNESLQPQIATNDLQYITQALQSEEHDALLVFWAPQDDIKTALETIEERCLMAFEGVPPETRKSFANGTTIFERVLPGADRMYPDTDSAPIPLELDYIASLKKDLPNDITERYQQLQQWKVAEDNYTYILSKNLFPLIEKIYKELEVPPRFTALFLCHHLKYAQGHFSSADHFDTNSIYTIFKYLITNKIHINIAYKMLYMLYKHPKMQLDSVLHAIGYKTYSPATIEQQIPFLKEKFTQIARHASSQNQNKWVMGELRGMALGNMDLAQLYHSVADNK